MAGKFWTFDELDAILINRHKSECGEKGQLDKNQVVEIF